MSGENESDLLPRKCILRKTENFNGFGFNLHAEKGRAGQYIGKVDPGSPAEVAKLKQGDRIVEVDGVNIGNENHQQVVSRIKACGDVTELLVVDSGTDKHYKDSKIVLSSTLTEVVTNDSGFMQSTVINEDEGQTNIEENGEVHHVEINGHSTSNGFYEGQNGHTVQAAGEDDVEEAEESEKVTEEGDYVNQEVATTQNAHDSDAHDSDALDSDAHDYVNVHNDINATHDFGSAPDPEKENEVEDRDEETTPRNDTPEPEVYPAPVEDSPHAIELSEHSDDEAQDNVTEEVDRRVEPEPEPRRDEETGVEVDPEEHESKPAMPEVAPAYTAETQEETSFSPPVSNGLSDAGFTQLSAKEIREQLLQKKKPDVRTEKLDFQHKLNMFNSMK